MGQETNGTDWRTKALVVGGAFGLLAGLGAAYLYVQSMERSGERASFKMGDGVKIGLLVLGLLRSVGQLGDGK